MGRPVVVRRRRLTDHPSPTPQPTPCRLWQGATRKGYGVRPDGVAVHRWVVASVLGWAAIDDLSVRHRCDQPLCYRYEHLEPGTHAENMADMMSRGRHRTASPQGEAHGRAKLALDDVVAIRARANEPRRRLAEEYGISVVQINKIIQRRAWRTFA